MCLFFVFLTTLHLIIQGMDPKKRRQQLIARLPDLKKLNGSRVTDTEKEGAERAFIRRYMDTENSPTRYGCSKTSFLGNIFGNDQAKL